MKILLCVSIVFCSGCIGILLKNEYVKKVNFLQEFTALLQYLSIKTAFFKDTLSDNVLNFVKINKPKNNMFFTNLAKIINDCSLSLNGFAKLVPVDIADAEKQQLYLCISGLTTADILSVNKVIEDSIASVNIMLQKYIQQKKQKGDVISKLAVALGLLVCILVY